MTLNFISSGLGMARRGRWRGVQPGSSAAARVRPSGIVWPMRMRQNQVAREHEAWQPPSLVPGEGRVGRLPQPPQGASSTCRPDPSGTTCATSWAPPAESCSTSVAERSRCARSCPTGSRTSASTSPSRSSASATARATRVTSRGRSGRSTTPRSTWPLRRRRWSTSTIPRSSCPRPIAYCGPAAG